MNTLNERARVTACITTWNEEQNIDRCLSSLDWCDEIVVVDSFSTDRTVELCRRYTDRVYQHAWLGYIGQKNLAREKASHPWVLYVDADEEVSPQLKSEILAELREPGNLFVGYTFPRMVRYLGRWIRHGEWYPDLKLRLFLKAKGRSGGQEPHDQVLIEGPVKQLNGQLYHYSYDDIRDHLNRTNHYSSISAEEKFKAGHRVHLTDIAIRPFLRFIRAYFLRAGFLDGRRGFLIALIIAFGVCMKYAKLWELELKAAPLDSAR